MRILTSLAIALCLAGCGSSSTTDMGSANDLSVASGDLSAGQDLASSSLCGKPGDTGNSKGVGKYCKTNTDCGGGSLLCSALFRPGTNFCTLSTVCNPNISGSPGVDTATCGENTVCLCDPNLGGACGCTPTACAPTPQG